MFRNVESEQAGLSLLFVACLRGGVAAAAAAIVDVVGIYDSFTGLNADRINE